MKNNATFVKSVSYLTTMYFRCNIPKNISDIKDKKVDLRLRITDKKPELALKHRTFSGNDARREFNFLIKNKIIFRMDRFSQMPWVGKSSGLCKLSSSKEILKRFRDFF